MARLFTIGSSRTPRASITSALSQHGASSPKLRASLSAKRIFGRMFLASGHALGNLRTHQLAQGVAADPTGGATIGRLEALGNANGRRVGVGAPLPNLTDGSADRFLHEVALVARLALDAVEVAMEQSCGYARVLRGHLRHQNKAGPLDILLGPLAPDQGLVAP